LSRDTTRYISLLSQKRDEYLGDESDFLPRFSTPEQKLGNSTERQLKAARDYCDRNGLDLDEDLSIADEGLSGYKGHNVERGSLGHFLAEVKAGKIPTGTALIIENLDRLSRQGIDKTTDLLKALTQAGIEVHVIAIGRVLKAGFNNSLVDYMLIGVQADLAYQESAKKAERVSSAWSSKKAKAVNGLAITPRCPSWIKAEMGKAPVVIEKRAKIVRRIFELASLGLGCKKIVRSLISEGHAPFTSDKGKQGMKWTPEFIQTTLRNRSVLGEYQPHRLVNGERIPEGEVIPDFYPAVVEPSLFESARTQVTAKNRNLGKVGGNRGGGKSTVNNLFSNLAYDGDRPLCYYPGKLAKNGNKLPYLVTKWAPKQKQNWLRYDKFENAFLGFLKDLDWKSVAGESESDEVKNSQAELETVLSEIDRTSAKIANLQKLVDEGVFSKSLFDTLDAENGKMADYTSRRESLAAAVTAARSKAEALYSPQALIAAIRSGDVNLRLKLKNEIAKRISKISVDFSEEVPLITINFVNGALRGIILEERPLLLRIEGSL
jgi:DNA invertase Pin-like site-specific DNA recombinase